MHFTRIYRIIIKYRCKNHYKTCYLKILIKKNELHTKLNIDDIRMSFQKKI